MRQIIPAKCSTPGNSFQHETVNWRRTGRERRGMFYAFYVLMPVYHSNAAPRPEKPRHGTRASTFQGPCARTIVQAFHTHYSTSPQTWNGEVLAW